MSEGDLDEAVAHLAAAVRRLTAAGQPMFRSSSMAPDTADVMRRLGDLAPTTLAVMHGASYQGDGGKALYDLAGAYEQQYLRTGV